MGDISSRCKINPCSHLNLFKLSTKYHPYTLCIYFVLLYESWVLPYSFCEKYRRFSHTLSLEPKDPSHWHHPHPYHPNPILSYAPAMLLPLHRLTYVTKVQAIPVIECKSPTCTQNSSTPLVSKDPLSVATPALSLPPIGWMFNVQV